MLFCQIPAINAGCFFMIKWDTANNCKCSLVVNIRSEISWPQGEQLSELLIWVVSTLLVAPLELQMIAKWPIVSQGIPLDQDSKNIKLRVFEHLSSASMNGIFFPKHHVYFINHFKPFIELKMSNFFSGSFLSPQLCFYNNRNHCSSPHWTGMRCLNSNYMT